LVNFKICIRCLLFQYLPRKKKRKKERNVIDLHGILVLFTNSALAAQSLGVIMAILPHIKSGIMHNLKKEHQILLGDYDRLHKVFPLPSFIFFSCNILIQGFSSVRFIYHFFF